MGVSKKSGASGELVEVDSTSKAERVILYDFRGEVISAREIHGSVIAINPLIEGSSTPTARATIFIVWNPTARRVTVESVQLWITSDNAAGGAATLQRYDLLKCRVIDNFGLPTNGRYTRGTPRRTESQGVLSPPPTRTGAASTFYNGGHGPFLVLNFWGSSGILLSPPLPAFQVNGALWVGAHGRPALRATSFFQTQFNVPLSPVTHLDTNEAMVLAYSGLVTATATDRIGGTIQLSIHPDPERGARGG